MKSYTIEVVVKISGLNDWDVRWDREVDANEELLKLKGDIKEAIARNVGIDLRDIDIEEITLKS